MHQPLRDGPVLPTRIKGRPVLIRRMRGLLIALNRFGRARASSREDIVWAAKMIDGLTALLQEGTANAPDQR